MGIRGVSIRLIRVTLPVSFGICLYEVHGCCQLRCHRDFSRETFLPSVLKLRAFREQGLEFRGRKWELRKIWENGPRNKGYNIFGSIWGGGSWDLQRLSKTTTHRD